MSARDQMVKAWVLYGLLCLASLYSVQPYSLGWNSTPSIPTGLYLTKAHDGSMPGRGDTMCFPYEEPSWAAGRNYFVPGLRLCKPVAGIAGDVVHKDATRIRVLVGDQVAAEVNAAATDRHGRALNTDALKPGVIEPGHVVLIAPSYANSMDSRFLGALPASALSHQIWPIWVSN